MKNWDELRTALLVARLGTVSAAATALGIHRATVNRHIDILEASFKVKLFQRHSRGYDLTEAGQEMFQVAKRADEMFGDLLEKSRGRSKEFSGKLVVTSITPLASMIMPAIQSFSEKYPAVDVEFVSSFQQLNLEISEAHVAIRVGKKPVNDEYAVLPFEPVRFGLYAHNSYIEKFGFPERQDDWSKHKFVGSIEAPKWKPFNRWMARYCDQSQLAVHIDDQDAILPAVAEGMGLGFIAEHIADPHKNLVEIIPPSDEMSVSLWIVTHKDLRFVTKVKEFISCLQALHRVAANPTTTNTDT